jgi:Alpha-L-arabinofuranosidase B, catalytic
MLRKVCFSLLAGLLAAVSARADVPVPSRLFTSLSYPVDIARAASLQVGAAYSTFRAMSANYAGPLFLLQRTSDSAYTAINTAGRGGPADFGAITSFCAARNTNGCQIVAICDQMHQTCSLSGGLPVNFSPVSVTVASPTLVTWSNGAGTTPPNNTPIFFDYKSHVGVDLNTKMPTGLAVNNGTCSNCHTQWYCTANVSSNTFNVYPATLASAGTLTTNATTASGNAILHFNSVPSWVVPGLFVADTTSPSVLPAGNVVLSTTSTSVTVSANATGSGVGSSDTIAFSYPNSPTCPGASGNLVNVTGAGTASGLTANLGSNNNDLNAYASNTAPPYLGFVSFPNGEVIPVWSSASGQLARARVSSNIPGTIPQNNINRTVYALFTTMTIGTNAGTFGIMEDVISNKGANTMFAMGINDNSSTGAFCSGVNGPDVPCLAFDIENGIFASTSMSPGLNVSNNSPAIVTWNNHMLQAGTPVVFQDNAGDTLPSPLAKNTVYYVLNPATNTFNLSATPFGSAINTSTNGSRTHIVVGKPQTATWVCNGAYDLR